MADLTQFIGGSGEKVVFISGLQETLLSSPLIIVPSSKQKVVIVHLSSSSGNTRDIGLYSGSTAINFTLSNGAVYGTNSDASYISAGKTDSSDLSSIIAGRTQTPPISIGNYGESLTIQLESGSPESVYCSYVLVEKI